MPRPPPTHRAACRHIHALCLVAPDTSVPSLLPNNSLSGCSPRDASSGVRVPNARCPAQEEACYREPEEFLRLVLQAGEELYRVLPLLPSKEEVEDYSPSSEGEELGRLLQRHARGGRPSSYRRVSSRQELYQLLHSDKRSCRADSRVRRMIARQECREVECSRP